MHLQASKPEPTLAFPPVNNEMNELLPEPVTPITAMNLSFGLA